MLERRKLKLKANVEAVNDIIVSSAKAIDTFDTGFDTVNLHRPTMQSSTCALGPGLARDRGTSHR